MADEDHPVKAELVHDRLRVASERLDRPRLACASRAPVAGEVEGHDRMFPGQHRHHRVPEVLVAEPAMDEDDRRTALTGHPVPNGHAVRRGGGAFPNAVGDGSESDRGCEHSVTPPQVAS